MQMLEFLQSVAYENLAMNESNASTKLRNPYASTKLRNSYTITNQDRLLAIL